MDSDSDTCNCDRSTTLIMDKCSISSRKDGVGVLFCAHFYFDHNVIGGIA